MNAKKKSFIHFGCWNNLCNENNTGLRDVIATLKKYIQNPTTTTDVQFISVAGDNYYALKHKKNSSDPTKVRNIKVTQNNEDVLNSESASYLSKDDIQKGFNQLQSINDKIPINVIYGNHDLEKNEKFTVANNINCNKEQITVELAENTQYGNKDCQMMEDQKTTVENLNTTNMIIDKFIIPSFDEDTFVCMIDSTVYSNDFNQGCYEKDKQVEIDKQNLDVLCSYNKIKNKESVKNIIIIGHHPITFEKGKSVDKTKVKTLVNSNTNKNSHTKKIAKDKDKTIPTGSPAGTMLEEWPDGTSKETRLAVVRVTSASIARLAAEAAGDGRLDQSAASSSARALVTTAGRSQSSSKAMQAVTVSAGSAGCS